MQSAQFPPAFKLEIRPLGKYTYELAASQVLPLTCRRVFSFFEDPRNLFDITPPWLWFVMREGGTTAGVCEGAEFDYTIRWLGLTIPWRSRITGYLPPERFTDIQVQGPYRLWSHLHVFEPGDGGTCMRDTVTYRLPGGPIGTFVHAVAVRRQLEDIFRYRAVRIDSWAKGEPIGRTPAGETGPGRSAGRR